MNEAAKPDWAQAFLHRERRIFESGENERAALCAVRPRAALNRHLRQSALP
ncbi:MAG: hypothetical protein SPG32_11125 [Candidatus Ventricola sp.]|nr:hypothetical protein [Candidatus Ventricola sp.]